MPNTIQPQEYSRGGGMEGTSYRTDSDGNLNIFNVEHDDDDLWLNANYGNPDNFYNGNNRFLFVLPRISLQSPAFIRRGFVFVAVRSNHRAFCRSHQFLMIGQYTF